MYHVSMLVALLRKSCCPHRNYESQFDEEVNRAVGEKCARALRGATQEIETVSALSHNPLPPSIVI